MKENDTPGEPQTVFWVVVQVSVQRGRKELEQEESFVLNLYLKTQGASNGGEFQTSTSCFGKITLTAAWRMGDGGDRLGASQEVS